MNSEYRSRRTEQGGFSLLELVVTIALFTIVMGAVYGLLAVGTSDTFTTKQRVEMMQNTRVAMDAIGRDAINAGVGFPRDGATIPDNKLSLFGLPNDIGTEFDRITPILAGDNLYANAINPTPNTKTDQITFLFQDDEFNNGGPVDVTAINGGQQLRLEDVVATDLCTNGDLYIIWGSTSAIAMVTNVPGGSNNAVDCAASDPLGINVPGANGPLGKLSAGPKTLYKVAMVTYYVTSEGTLMRRVWGNPTELAGEGTQNTSTTAGWFDSPLAFNVEDMQFSYVLAPNGVVVTNPTEAERSNIRQVQVTLTVRSPQSDTRNRAFRTTLTSTFSTRNLVYSKQLGGGGD